MNGLFRTQRLGSRRRRAFVTVCAIAAGVALLLFALPMPLWTNAEGVVWLPEHSQVRTEADAFVSRLLVEPGARVERGTPIILTEDPLLETQGRLLASRVAELEAQLAGLQFVDRARADSTRKELETARAARDDARARLASLVIASPADGVVVIPHAVDLPGRFVRRGERLGWVAEDHDTVLRVVVSQDDIGLVRDRNEGVEVAVTGWGNVPVPARVVREVPAAFDQLPDAALGSAGGGPFATDPRDPEGLKTFEKIFQLDLALADRDIVRRVGQRVLVRFEHGREAPARQLYRATRQLFLHRFGI